jgi:hypothetical protein
MCACVCVGALSATELVASTLLKPYVSRYLRVFVWLLVIQGPPGRMSSAYIDITRC